MKRSLIRWTAASLVAASLGLALGGCGSKDKTTSSSEKASSSKVEKKPKASLNKKATVSSSQAKENTTPSSQASNPSASTEPNKAEDTSSTDQAVVPAALVGTWVGSSPQADSIKMTIEANGDITTVVSFKMIVNQPAQPPILQELFKHLVMSITGSQKVLMAQMLFFLVLLV